MINVHTTNATTLHRFRSFFGVTPGIRATPWLKIRANLPFHSMHHTFLWRLTYLRPDPTISELSALVRAHPKTTRKWVLLIAHAIFAILVVSPSLLWATNRIRSNYFLKVHWKDRLKGRGFLGVYVPLVAQNAKYASQHHSLRNSIRIRAAVQVCVTKLLLQCTAGR